MATLQKEILNASKVESILNKHLHDLVDIIDRNMATQGRHVFRHTIDSARVEVKGGTGILWGNGSFFALEGGRKGGRVPVGFYKIILDWVKERGIEDVNGKYKQSSVAWFIANKIREDGSKMYRDHTFQDIFSKAVKDEIDSIELEISTAVSSEIEYLNNEFTRGGIS